MNGNNMMNNMNQQPMNNGMNGYQQPMNNGMNGYQQPVNNGMNMYQQPMGMNTNQPYYNNNMNNGMNGKPANNKIKIIAIIAVVLVGLLLLGLLSGGGSSNFTCSYTQTDPSTGITVETSLTAKKDDEGGIRIEQKHILSRSGGFTEEERAKIEGNLDGILIGGSYNTDGKAVLSGDKVIVTGSFRNLAYTDPKDYRNDLASQGYDCN